MLGSVGLAWPVPVLFHWELVAAHSWGHLRGAVASTETVRFRRRTETAVYGRSYQCQNVHVASASSASAGSFEVARTAAANYRMDQHPIAQLVGLGMIDVSEYRREGGRGQFVQATGIVL